MSDLCATIGAGVVHNNLVKQYVGAHWFRTEEWFRFPVDMSEQWDPQACKDYVTNEDENHTAMGFNGKLFHGCPFGAFLGMLGKGGFVRLRSRRRRLQEEDKDSEWGLLHDRFL